MNIVIFLVIRHPVQPVISLRCGRIIYEAGKINEITVPVELLVPFLAEHNIAVNLGVALAVIYRFGNEMHPLSLRKYFEEKSFSR